MEMAERMKIGRVAFWPASAALLATLLHIPRLIRDGIVEENELAPKSRTFELAPEMPTLKTDNLVRLCIGDETSHRIIFSSMLRNNMSVKSADWILCNSCNDIEPSAFALAPQVQPIGPMFSNNRLGNNSDGKCWAHDTTCLEWLDQQQPLSVIYVAFGSFIVFDQTVP